MGRKNELKSITIETRKINLFASLKAQMNRG